jgi:hypothetical protein
VKQKSFGQSIIPDDKQFEIRHQKMRTYKNRMNSSALSDMNEKKLMYYLHKWKVQMRSCFITKKLTKNLKEVLPAVKIIKLRKSEEGFNRKLLHQYIETRK